MTTPDTTVITCSGCGREHEHVPVWGNDGRCICTCCETARDNKDAERAARRRAEDEQRAAAAEARREQLLTCKPMKFHSGDIDDVELYIFDREIWFQQKIDGMRVIVCCDGAGNVEVVGGMGGPSASTTIAPTVERLRHAFTAVSKAGQVVAIDGEIVDGRFHAFDLPRWGWSDGRLPIRPETGFAHRYRALDKFLSVANLPEDLVIAVPVAKREHDKFWLWDRVIEDGLEGVIARGRWAPYVHGRTDRSLKLKVTHTVDCVVLDRNVGGKENAVLGLYRPVDGAEDGGIAIGPDTEITHELVKVGSCSMIGKPDARPGDVVEVRYLYAGAGGQMVQPTVMRLRQPDDKDAASCTIDQLVHVNKTVLEEVSWTPRDPRVRRYSPEREAAQRRAREIRMAGQDKPDDAELRLMAAPDPKDR